jgi:hypothetical protein
MGEWDRIGVLWFRFFKGVLAATAAALAETAAALLVLNLGSLWRRRASGCELRGGAAALCFSAANADRRHCLWFLLRWPRITRNDANVAPFAFLADGGAAGAGLAADVCAARKALRPTPPPKLRDGAAAEGLARTPSRGALPLFSFSIERATTDLNAAAVMYKHFGQPTTKQPNKRNRRKIPRTTHVQQETPC